MPSYLHSGSLGDIIFAIPSIKALTGFCKRSDLYLRADVPDQIPAWAGRRPAVRMAKAEAESLITLLRALKHFDKVELYTDQPIDYDLDIFRDKCDTARGDISRYIAYAYKCRPRLYEAWLDDITPSL